MRFTVGVTVCLGVMLLGAGCASQPAVKQAIDDATKNAGQKLAEGVIKARTGQDVKVDFDQKGASFVDPSTGRAFAIGEKVTIPSSFPKDVPLYPKATPTSLDVTAGSTDAGVLLVSDDKRKDVQDWYAKEAVSAGWTVDGSHDVVDRVILSFKRDEHGGTARLTVSLSSDGQGRTDIILARKGVK
jgi:hypothetical protein